MIKFLIVFLMAVGIVVSQSEKTTEASATSTTNKMTGSMATGQTSTMSTLATTPTSGAGTGGFRLHSFNLLFLPLTITASVFYLSC